MLSASSPFYGGVWLIDLGMAMGLSIPSELPDTLLIATHLFARDLMDGLHRSYPSKVVPLARPFKHRLTSPHKESVVYEDYFDAARRLLNEWGVLANPDALTQFNAANQQPPVYPVIVDEKKLTKVVAQLDAESQNRDLPRIDGPVPQERKRNDSRTDEGLSFSDDFKSVSFGKRNHILKDRQARAIRLLYDRSMKSPKNPWLSQKAVLSRLVDKEVKYGGSLRDIFKSNPTAWKALIEKHPNKLGLIRFRSKLQPLT